jgi:hypothetical protein
MLDLKEKQCSHIFPCITFLCLCCICFFDIAKFLFSGLNTILELVQSCLHGSSLAPKMQLHLTFLGIKGLSATYQGYVFLVTSKCFLIKLVLHKQVDFQTTAHNLKRVLQNSWPTAALECGLIHRIMKWGRNYSNHKFVDISVE